MINKVKCINNVGQYGTVFALTIGNIYEVRETKGEYMIILANDNGAICGYHKRHFEILEEKKLLTDQEVLESIVIVDDKIVKMKNREGNFSRLWLFNCWSTNDFGCGNKALYKIENLIDSCKGLDSSLKDLKIPIFKKVLEKVMEHLRPSTGLILLSTYTNRNGEIIPFLSALEDMSTGSAEAHNPNSSNDICIWILATGKPKKRKTFNVD